MKTPRALLSLLSARSPRSVFEKIYKSNLWGAHESRSGTGSDLYQTRRVRKYLPELVERLEVSSLLDLPCGDFYWMQSVNLNCAYIGADLVGELVNDNNSKFGDGQKQFRCLDLLSEIPPKCDLVLTRDLLVHFSFLDAQQALRNLSESGARWLLTTTFPKVTENRDIRSGRWRPINLELHPFNFPAPVELLNEGCTEAGGRYADKSLGLWRIEDLQI